MCDDPADKTTQEHFLEILYAIFIAFATNPFILIPDHFFSFGPLPIMSTQLGSD
jgi:hypothetical protein